MFSVIQGSNIIFFKKSIYSFSQFYETNFHFFLVFILCDCSWWNIKGYLSRISLETKERMGNANPPPKKTNKLVNQSKQKSREKRHMRAVLDCLLVFRVTICQIVIWEKTSIGIRLQDKHNMWLINGTFKKAFVHIYMEIRKQQVFLSLCQLPKSFYLESFVSVTFRAKVEA